jgi:hypothetical protein
MALFELPRGPDIDQQFPCFQVSGREFSDGHLGFFLAGKDRNAQEQQKNKLFHDI